ncbi:MAG: response regulator [Pyrinomonadaceae bacterium]
MQNSTRPTIMVVDDYDDIRAILKRWLEQAGYHVIEATNGREAVEMAERERPELILMDLALPEVDGFAATVRIRLHADLRDVPIIAISAFGDLGVDDSLEIDAHPAGFNAYLPKPFAPQKLLDLVNLYLPNTAP